MIVAHRVATPVKVPPGEDRLGMTRARHRHPVEILGLVSAPVERLGHRPASVARPGRVRHECEILIGDPPGPCVPNRQNVARTHGRDSALTENLEVRLATVRNRRLELRLDSAPIGRLERLPATVRSDPTELRLDSVPIENLEVRPATVRNGRLQVRLDTAPTGHLERLPATVRNDPMEPRRLSAARPEGVRDGNESSTGGPPEAGPDVPSRERVGQILGRVSARSGRLGLRHTIAVRPIRERDVIRTVALAGRRRPVRANAAQREVQQAEVVLPNGPPDDFPVPLAPTPRVLRGGPPRPDSRDRARRAHDATKPLGLSMSAVPRPTNRRCRRLAAAGAE
jgi:hypothetical protein